MYIKLLTDLFAITCPFKRIEIIGYIHFFCRLIYAYIRACPQKY